MHKLIAVIGPTAAGKSELAVELAKQYNGEIISADSRQIYRGLDLGSGKVEGRWVSFPSTRNPGSHEGLPGIFHPKDPGQPSSGKAGLVVSGDPKKVYIYRDIAHHLIDEVSPKKQFSVAQFKAKAEKLMEKIWKRKRVPILCGGTMHWIDAVVYDQTLPEVKPNPELRKELGQLSTGDLFKRLKKLDPDRAAVIDQHNPRRLIRAIEIVETTGQPVPEQQHKSPYDITWIGINPGMEQLEKNIKKRLDQRLDQGLIKEVEDLHAQGITWQRLEDFGLEYRYVAWFLQDKLSEQELREQLYTAIRQYAKRQLTWWKRNKDIKWFKTEAEALKALPKQL